MPCPTYTQINGVKIHGATNFECYAKYWMDTAELAPKTRNQYLFLLKEINRNIGHITLESLTAEHLKILYTHLRQEKVLIRKSHATATYLPDKRESANISIKNLAILSCLSENTVSEACKRKNVSLDTAYKIATALNIEAGDIFDFTIVKGSLSAKTIRHYHTLIRAILASAKREQHVTANVAAEHMKSPKASRPKVNFLNDIEARQFVNALFNEPDIRIKTSLIIAIFTGLRRGELLGLEWQDIDFNQSTVNIVRASQYITSQGIIEVPTKTESSNREIKVSSFVVQTLLEYQKWWLTFCTAQEIPIDLKNGRLFISKNGAPLFPDTINRWLRKFTIRNNLPLISPQGLRHTFATLQLTSGVDLRTLQSRTGHAQASTLLNVYSHVIKKAQDQATIALDDVLLRDIAVPSKTKLKSELNPDNLQEIENLFLEMKNKLLKLYIAD